MFKIHIDDEENYKTEDEVKKRFRELEDESKRNDFEIEGSFSHEGETVDFEIKNGKTTFIYKGIKGSLSSVMEKIMVEVQNKKKNLTI